MTKMQKGFVAMLLTMALAIGAVASADSRHAASVETAQQRTAVSAQPQSRNEAVATPDLAKPDKVKPTRAGAILKITDLTQMVTDDGAATVTLEAGAVLENSSREALNLRDVRVMLQDESGKYQIPARIVLAGEGSGLLEPGQSAEVKLLFAGVPTDAGPLKPVMQAPNGGAVVNAIGIEIHCSWPPLRCKLVITFEL